MADDLTPAAAILLACLAGLGAAAAHADHDPTRPPPGLADNSPEAAQAVQAAPQVSSIFRAGRLVFAIIDGREVKVGDRLGDGRVTRIDETGVWLRTPQGSRLLPLLPEVKKRPSGP
ncbi:MAG TPA: hypothetical protein PLW81_07165 [Thiobacillaceae bacterium]|nr:hypothetical protein [Thiobacillaceae bacterium]